LTASQTASPNDFRLEAAKLPGAMTALPDRMSLTEFLDWERAQPDRWEFADGYAWPTAGTTDAHGQIVLNLGALLRVKLRGTDCRAFTSTVKVVAGGRSTYPDIVVTCDPRDRTDRYAKRHPRLLVEVLSKTTAGDDLSDKFAAYRSIETLAEYLTPDSRKRAVQLWRKNARGHWELVEDRTDGELHLETVDLTVTFEALYEDVEFDDDTERDFPPARQNGDPDGS
jgi:Uma2 family endonuclease